MNLGERHTRSGAVLFLDTPRAGEGLNHRFFVAHPAGCDEAQVVRWATQARENSSGLDYLAVSRPVSQVLRGQTRSGTELLVFAGISTGDSERNARIRARLDSMLDMLQGEQGAAEGNGVGLLLPSRKIAEFQRELLTQTEAAQDSTESAGPPAPSRRQGKLKHLLMLLSLIVVVGAVVLAQIGTPHGNSRPANDKSPESASKEKKGAWSFPSKKEPEPDWSFLRDAPYWQSLARLTAFHGDQANATAAQSWAKSLLTAADPGWQAKEATPGDLKHNKHVGSLLDAVRSASRETSNPDSESVSKQWLSSLPNNDTKDISEFWDALSKPRASAAALKKLFADWEQKLIGAASHPTGLTNLDEELRPFAALKSEPASAEIQILTQSDIGRFLRLKTFFDSDGFSNAIAQSAYGENWKSRDWTERLSKLKGLSTDGQLPERLRSLCNELHSLVIR